MDKNGCWCWWCDYHNQDNPLPRTDKELADAIRNAALALNGAIIAAYTKGVKVESYASQMGCLVVTSIYREETVPATIKRVEIK